LETFLFPLVTFPACLRIKVLLAEGSRGEGVNLRLGPRAPGLEALLFVRNVFKSGRGLVAPALQASSAFFSKEFPLDVIVPVLRVSLEEGVCVS